MILLGGRKLLFICMLCICIVNPVLSQNKSELEKYTAGHEKRMEWWRDAKYGLFVHWGLYAQLGGQWKGKQQDGDNGEWIMFHEKIPLNEYKEVAKQFNPVGFNADEWVKIVKAAGMKYIVITAKHCEGFAMFHSKANSYNIVDATPFGRDPLMELRKACDKHGIKLGFYYSHTWDWSHPHAKGLYNSWDFPDVKKKNVEKYYDEKSIPQINELTNNYKPDIMWFDVPSDITRQRSLEILKIIRTANPDCIINDRISQEHNSKELVMGDYFTPEQYIPENLNVDFETCMTLNGTWGYKYFDTNWKDAKTILQNLLKNISQGGNYLLNVGPDARGKIPAASVAVLKIAGNWIKRNKEGIYATVKSPIGQVYYKNAVCVAKPGKLFIHIFKIPEQPELVIGEINADISSIYFLQDEKKGKLNYKQTNENDLIIAFDPVKIPSNLIDPLITTIVIEYKGELKPREKPMIVDYFNPVTFYVSDAKLKGDVKYGLNKRWHPYKGYEIRKWNNKGAISWNYRTIRNGKYKIELVYGANDLSHDNDIHVKINGKTFMHKIKDTPGWYKEVKKIIGEVELKAGTTDSLVAIAGYSNTHAIANLKRINLIPIPGN